MCLQCFWVCVYRATFCHNIIRAQTGFFTNAAYDGLRSVVQTATNLAVSRVCQCRIKIILGLMSTRLLSSPATLCRSVCNRWSENWKNVERRRTSRDVRWPAWRTRLARLESNWTTRSKNCVSTLRDASMSCATRCFQNKMFFVLLIPYPNFTEATNIWWRRLHKDSIRLTLVYASRQSDAYQLRRQSLQCSWTSSLELSANGHTAVSDSRWRRFCLVSKTKAQCELA